MFSTVYVIGIWPDLPVLLAVNSSCDAHECAPVCSLVFTVLIIETEKEKICAFLEPYVLIAFLVAISITVSLTSPLEQLGTPDIESLNRNPNNTMVEHNIRPKGDPRRPFIPFWSVRVFSSLDNSLPLSLITLELMLLSLVEVAESNESFTEFVFSSRLLPQCLQHFFPSTKVSKPASVVAVLMFS